jgi:hypothetical protein
MESSYTYTVVLSLLCNILMDYFHISRKSNCVVFVICPGSSERLRFGHICLPKMSHRIFYNKQLLPDSLHGNA